MKVFCSINVLKCFIYVKNHILSNLFFKHKPSFWRHLVSATSFWCTLPLTTLVAHNETIAPYKTNKPGYFKGKVEQISLRIYSRCDSWRVTDLKFNLASPCENLQNVNCDQQRCRSACLRSLNNIHNFFDSRISTDVKANLIMLKPEWQWCSLFLWLRRLVWILPGRTRNL